jgi:hypothetical protein
LAKRTRLLVHGAPTTAIPACEGRAAFVMILLLVVLYVVLVLYSSVKCVASLTLACCFVLETSRDSELLKNQSSQ